MYCDSQKSFTCLATNPPIFGKYWDGNYYVSYYIPGTIYVLAVSVGAYKAADGWEEYKCRVGCPRSKSYF